GPSSIAAAAGAMAKPWPNATSADPDPLHSESKRARRGSAPGRPGTDSAPSRSALTLDKKQQLPQRMRRLPQWFGLARPESGLDLLVKVDGLLAILRVHLVEQTARALHQLPYLAIGVRPRF